MRVTGFGARWLEEIEAVLLRLEHPPEADIEYLLQIDLTREVGSMRACCYGMREIFSGKVSPKHVLALGGLYLRAASEKIEEVREWAARQVFPCAFQ